MTFDTLTTGGLEQKLADWGFELSSCAGEKRSQSADIWSGRIVISPVQNNPVFAFEQQVTIQSGRISASGLPNTFSGGVIKFVGVRVLNPTKSDSSGPGFTYEFQGGRYFLDNCQYKQNYANGIGACYPAEIILFTRATLPSASGVTGTYTNISPGQQISDIVNYAISQGLNAQLGTVDIGLNAIFPSLICKPMTCSAAIDKCLEMFPRTNEVWDYTTTPPTVSFRQTKNLTPVTLPLMDGVNHKSINITRRDDLLVRGVVITYRITSQINGNSVVSYAIDQWGPVMEAAYQNAGGDSNPIAGNVAAQAKSAQSFYLVAYNAYIAANPNKIEAADIAAQAAVKAAQSAGTCDPTSGIRVPADIIDLSGTKTTTATAFLDCEPVLACITDGTAQTQAYVRQWWAEHRGGGVSELGGSKIRFQNTEPGTLYLDPVTIPNATLDSGDLTGASILNPGKGYSSGDILQLVGGTPNPNGPNGNAGSPALIQVQDVDTSGSITGSPGAILSCVITNGGYYMAGKLPPSPANTTYYNGAGGNAGGGTGATFNVSFLTLSQLLAQYPNRIVRGTHHSWMTNNGVPVVSVKVRVKSIMQYAEYDVFAQFPDDGISTNEDGTAADVTQDTAQNGNLINYHNGAEHHCDLELTNGVTGTYSTISSSTPGDIYVIGVTSAANTGTGSGNGIARTLFLALNQYQYQGDYVKVETSFTNGVTLNNTLNLSGGQSQWFSMMAQITGIREDYGTHNTSIQIGPSKHLSAQQLSSLLNTWRLRQPWFNPAVREDNTQLTNGGDIDLPVTSGNSNTTKGVNPQAQTQFITYNS